MEAICAVSPFDERDKLILICKKNVTIIGSPCTSFHKGGVYEATEEFINGFWQLSVDLDDQKQNQTVAESTNRNWENNLSLTSCFELIRCAASFSYAPFTFKYGVQDFPDR